MTLRDKSAYAELTVHFCHATQSLQFRGLRFCSDEDRNVGVGIFPESKEILIRGAALGSVALHRIGASQLKVGQRTNGFVEHNSAMVEDFLKLGCCFDAVACRVRASRCHHVGDLQLGAELHPCSTYDER